MSCEKYKSYEMGEMDKKDFLLHLKNCSDCRNIYRQYELLIQVANNLNKKNAVPDLWPGIKDILKKESGQKKFNLNHYVSNHKYFILRIAAVLLITILAGFYILSQPGQEKIDQSRLLDQAALKIVIEKEKDYIEAIERLEETASQRLAFIDENLIDLYKNKIRVIDQQITRCKDALESNPGNTHIRKYLFAVLQDKKQTLEEILTYPI